MLPYGKPPCLLFRFGNAKRFVRSAPLVSNLLKLLPYLLMPWSRGNMAKGRLNKRLPYSLRPLFVILGDVIGRNYRHGERNLMAVSVCVAFGMPKHWLPDRANLGGGVSIRRYPVPAIRYPCVHP